MTKLNFENAATPKQGGYLKPGIHEVKITGLVEVDGTKPYLEMGFVDENGYEYTDRMYRTEAAEPYTLLKLKEYLNVFEANPADYNSVAQLNALFSNKKVRLRLNGKVSTDGKYVNSEIGLQTPFVESLTVPEANTKLVFKLSEEAMAVLRNKEAVAEGTSTTETKSDNLPF